MSVWYSTAQRLLCPALIDSATGDADTGLVDLVRGEWTAVTRLLADSAMSARRKEFAMAKVLRCGDLMPGCNAVIEGKDEAEVIAKGAEHAKTAHKMTSIPPDVAAKVKAAIKDK